MDKKAIVIRKEEEYITLNILLKITDTISTGGMAKIYLQEHGVLVNGVNENRRGRKLYPNDKVVIEGIEYVIEKSS